MSIRLTILCENSVERVNPDGLLAEHGFACYLQLPTGNYLFDTGSGLTLLHNAERLDIDLTLLQGVFLSHGHLDHTGGLYSLLGKIRKIPIYAHPDVFSQRFSSNGGKLREIGIPWQQTALESVGAEFQLRSTARQVSNCLTLSGEVPRNSATETGDPNLLVNTPSGTKTTDPLWDDQSLYITTEKGLVILLGCAHAGLLNIIDHALEITGEKKIHMILGGTHLKFCSEQQLAATLDRLEGLDIDWIGASHCTGLRQAQKLAERFGEKFFFASVGAEIQI